MTTLPQLQENLTSVLSRISFARGRSPNAASQVRLVAVTKYVEATVLPLLKEAGVELIGENRVQAALAKHKELNDNAGLAWHFIGRLQSNKINKVLDLFSMIHSVDSLKLAAGISQRSLSSPMPVLFEVNLSGEESKSGFSADELRASFPALLKLPGILPRGLMTMAPFSDNPEDARPVFAGLRQLRDELQSRYELDSFTELSMGMSGDFEIAVEEGATLVRVGSALYAETNTA
ncbi:YggS family pyridoxal phosphate-dependent enzyme [bacterium]|nr:YggS family pyridoxal phosphate-dependent enzyme [bacterium]